MRHPEPTAIELGAPYIEGHDGWLPGAELGVLERGAVLRLFVPDPPDALFEAVVVGRIELRLAGHGPLTCLLFRLGEEPWDWTPYAWPLVDPDDRPVARPIVGAVAPEPFLVVLIDAETGLVEGLRLVRPDATFTQALRHAVLGQAVGAVPADDYNLALHALTMQPNPVPALLEATSAWWIGDAEAT